MSRSGAQTFSLSGFRIDKISGTAYDQEIPEVEICSFDCASFKEGRFCQRLADLRLVQTVWTLVTPLKDTKRVLS